MKSPVSVPQFGETVAEGTVTRWRHRHSPRVRRLAIEKGVDLEAMIGTGPGGRVSPADVLGAADAVNQPAVGRVATVRMVSSLQATAQLTTVVEVDMTRVVQLRDRVRDDLERRTGVRLTLTAFCAMAVLEALRLHPLLNASIDQDGHTVVHHASQHLGVAVDTPRGLVVPVLRDAGDLNLLGLARQITGMAQRARTGRIGPDELTGGTFTLIDTGSRGVLFDTPILNPPDVGILGTGAVVDRPVAFRREGGEHAIAIRSMAYFTLTYDHRFVDGAEAARYLATVRERLEAGEFAAELRSRSLSS